MNESLSLNPNEATDLLRREAENLQHLGSVRMQLVVEMGRKRMPLSEVSDLGPDDVIVLDKQAGEAFAVLANNHPFAESEIVVLGDRIACRLVRFHVRKEQAYDLRLDSIGSESLREES